MIGKNISPEIDKDKAIYSYKQNVVLEIKNLTMLSK